MTALPAGTVTFASSDSRGSFGKVACSTGSIGNVGSNDGGNSKTAVCQADRTPSTGAQTTITAAHPGDASHSSSTATLKLNGDNRGGDAGGPNPFAQTSFNAASVSPARCLVLF